MPDRQGGPPYYSLLSTGLMKELGAEDEARREGLFSSCLDYSQSRGDAEILILAPHSSNLPKMRLKEERCTGSRAIRCSHLLLLTTQT